jgi:hypothetical protein
MMRSTDRSAGIGNAQFCAAGIERVRTLLMVVTS